jgi:hypothetical protein
MSTTIIRKKVAWKKSLPAIILVLNSFVWYVITYLVFSTIVNELELLELEKLGLFTPYFMGIAVSSIIGSRIFPRARVNFLYLWLFIGAVATLLLITIPINGIVANALFALFLGISIGIGLPSCLSYFANLTSI